MKSSWTPRRDPKLLDAVKVDPKKNEVQVDLSRLYKGIDLPETLSNLTGKHIRRIKPDSVEFEDGNDQMPVVPICPAPLCPICRCFTKGEVE